jgi:predicted nucleic acid-binding protein
MTENNILVDSSFLVALGDMRDKYHRRAIEFAQHNQQQRVVPDVVLPEVTHLLNYAIGHHAVRVFLRALAQSDIHLEPITLDDLERAIVIMEQHADAKLDFVDCCIMALAERLNITRVCTFDRRDFSIFRPVHCSYLKLLP